MIIDLIAWFTKVLQSTPNQCHNKDRKPSLSKILDMDGVHNDNELGRRIVLNNHSTSMCLALSSKRSLLLPLKKIMIVNTLIAQNIRAVSTVNSNFNDLFHDKFVSVNFLVSI